MPVFAATNLLRIPTVKPTDVDACAMAATIAQLRGNVAKMNSQHDALCKQISEVTVAVNTVVDMKQQLDNNNNNINIHICIAPYGRNFRGAKIMCQLCSL